MEAILIPLCFGLAVYVAIKIAKLVLISEKVYKSKKEILKEIEERYKV